MDNRNQAEAAASELPSLSESLHLLSQVAQPKKSDNIVGTSPAGRWNGSRESQTTL